MATHYVIRHSEDVTSHKLLVRRSRNARKSGRGRALAAILYRVFVLLLDRQVRAQNPAAGNDLVYDGATGAVEEPPARLFTHTDLTSTQVASLFEGSDIHCDVEGLIPPGCAGANPQLADLYKPIS
jgi:hypothetical protein